MKLMSCPRCGGTGKVSDPRATGEEMKRLREQAKISLRTVAVRMGISPPYLSDMELGRRNFTIQMQDLFMAAIKETR